LGEYDRLIVLKVEAISSSETSINIYQVTWSNIQKDSHLHVHSRENLKFLLKYVKPLWCNDSVSHLHSGGKKFESWITWDNNIMLNPTKIEGDDGRWMTLAQDHVRFLAEDLVKLGFLVLAMLNFRNLLPDKNILDFCEWYYLISSINLGCNCFYCPAQFRLIKCHRSVGR
jgi:hypothetical protein